MELPFAVELSVGDGSFLGGVTNDNNSALHQSESSLVTASSQGSFMNTSPLGIPHNTPQDVVLSAPFHTAQQQQQLQQQQQGQGQLVVTPALSPQDHETDFTYVNVTETDADDDEVDILLEGEDFSLPLDQQYYQQPQGGILAALLSGMQPSETDSILVRVNMNSKFQIAIDTFLILLLTLSRNTLIPT
jgi:hypothetical protein